MPPKLNIVDSFHKTSTLKNPKLKKSTLKNKELSKKQEIIGSTSDQTRIKKAAQMKKDPEIISRALSYWLNQKE